MWFKKKTKKVEALPFIVQENPEQCEKIIINSFIGKYINDNVTDISYNGKDLYIQDNDKGRYKADILIKENDVYEILKKIANYMLKPFNNQFPFLDVAFNNYRLSAINRSHARTNNNRVCTFSLRLIFPKLRITNNDNILAPSVIHILLKFLVLSHETLLISGQTGSGKTELQKYLISFMNESERIIIIEDSYETHIKEIYPNMDITSWIVNEDEDSLARLVKQALRNNPDWLIIAETRGVEAYDMVNAIMTGHSAITTIHSESCFDSLSRIASICKRKIDFDEALFLNTIAKHIRIGIHMEKIFSKSLNKYIRRIESICEYIPVKKGYEANLLYKINKDENLVETYTYGYISSTLKTKFLKYDNDITLIERFINNEKE